MAIFGYNRPIPGYHVQGTSMTVPNLAQSLLDIIRMSRVGEPMPLTSPLVYDESDEKGLARAMAQKLDYSELQELHEAEGLKASERAVSVASEEVSIEEAKPTKQENETEA